MAVISGWGLLPESLCTDASPYRIVAALWIADILPPNLNQRRRPGNTFAVSAKAGLRACEFAAFTGLRDLWREGVRNAARNAFVSQRYQPTTEIENVD